MPGIGTRACAIRRGDCENSHSQPRSAACRADPFLSDYVGDMTSSTSLAPRQGGPKVNADLHNVAQQVREEFSERLDPRDVDECFDRVAAKFDNATVRAFVPLLVRRYVRDELQERLTEAKVS